MNSLLRPTRVRYIIVALTTLVAVLLYLDRISLSQVELYVREDLGMSRTQMGWAMSAFFWAYALGQVPGGWLADRYGARWMLSIYLALWSTFTGLMGFADSLAMVIVLRLLVGLFEAGCYPASAGLIRQWVPVEHRGLASGIVSLGGRSGNSICAFTTVFLIGFFFPSDTPNQFQERDLLETRLLCREIRQGPGSLAGRIGERLLQVLPSEVANQVRAAGDFNKKLEVEDVKKMQDLPEAYHAIVLAGLNELLAQEDLTQIGLPLIQKLPKSLRALIEEPGEGAARERSHRLLLEGVFPDSLRKIVGPGWRPTMIVYGAVGVLVALVFFWYFRDRPSQHSSVNTAELALIQGQTAPAASLVPSSALPVVGMITSFSMWMNSLLQFSTNVGWVFLMTWFPTFMVDQNVPLDERGLMTAIVFLVGLPSLVLGGRLTDWLVPRIGLRWGRALPMGLTRFISAGAFLFCLTTKDPWIVTIAMCVVQFGTDLGLPALWGYILDVGGKHTGSVLGWGNMFGNIGAALSPLLVAPFTAVKDWDSVFLVCASAFMVSGVAGFLIDATAPIRGADDGK